MCLLKRLSLDPTIQNNLTSCLQFSLFKEGYWAGDWLQLQRTPEKANYLSFSKVSGWDLAQRKPWLWWLITFLPSWVKTYATCLVLLEFLSLLIPSVIVFIWVGCGDWKLGTVFTAILFLHGWFQSIRWSAIVQYSLPLYSTLHETEVLCHFKIWYYQYDDDTQYTFGSWAGQVMMSRSYPSEWRPCGSGWGEKSSNLILSNWMAVDIEVPRSRDFPSLPLNGVVYRYVMWPLGFQLLSEVRWQLWPRRYLDSFLDWETFRESLMP